MKVASLWLTLFLLLLFPCHDLFAQQSEGEDAPATRLLWHAYRGAEQETLDALVDDWNTAHPDRAFRVLSIPYEVYASKLANDIPRGNGPDLFIAAHENTGQWVRSSLIAPFPLGEDAARLHPRTVEAVSFESQQWAMPLTYKSLVLFYNTDLVDHPPQTIEALVEDARAHSSPEEGRYGLVYEAANFYMHIPWLTSYGGEIFDAHGGVLLDAPATIASYAFASELVNDLRIVPEDASGSLVTHLFNSQQAAYAINGPWFIGELDASLPYAMAPLPRRASTDEPARPFLTVEAAFVSSSSPHAEDARDLARHLASHDASLTRATRAFQPVATLSVYDEPQVARMPQLVAFRAQLDQTLPMPNRPEMNAVWEPANQALRQVLRGAATPDAALQKAQRRYAFYTSPPPEARPIWPLVVGLATLLLAALLFAIVRYRQSSRDLLPRMRANRAAYLYLAPASIGMVLLIVMPFVVGSLVSLFAHRNGEFTYVGLTHFGNILFSQEYGLSDPLNFYFTLLVTVLWTAINVFLHVSVGLMLALLLREPWLKLRGLYRVLLIIPWAIPNYITALIWKGMFHKQFGAINGLLDLLGLEPISWFSQFSTAFAANVATNTWLGFPFMMVVILGALQAIPRDLEEAAEVDGASWWQRMRHVVFPLLRPSLVPAVILGTVWTFNMFNIIYLVSGGAPDGSTEILISEAYKWAFTRQQQYGYAAAYAVLIFFVLLVYSALTGQLKTGD